MKKKPVILFLISLVFISCVSKTDGFCRDYGVRYNDEREKVGLVNLNDSWGLEALEHKVYGGYSECIWTKKDQKDYAQKNLVFNEKDELSFETDSYYMGYKDDEGEPVIIYLEYDYEDDLLFFYSTEDLIFFPVYAEREEHPIHTDDFLEIIDFLHFDKEISWSQLPKVDEALFPLERVFP